VVGGERGGDGVRGVPSFLPLDRALLCGERKSIPNFLLRVFIGHIRRMVLVHAKSPKTNNFLFWPKHGGFF
jgi:hypothetical protein